MESAGLSLIPASVESAGLPLIPASVDSTMTPRYRPGSFYEIPLLKPSVWILDLIFANFGNPFWLVLADSGASGVQTSIPDDLTDLGTQTGALELVRDPFSIMFVKSVNDS